MSNKRYPEEFKSEIVRQITDRGYSVADVSFRLGVTTHSLYTRVKKYGHEAPHFQEKADSGEEIMSVA